MAQIYAQLQSACAVLARQQHHAIAAYLSLSMAMIHEEFGVGEPEADIDSAWAQADDVDGNAWFH